MGTVSWEREARGRKEEQGRKRKEGSGRKEEERRGRKRTPSHNPPSLIINLNKTPSRAGGVLVSRTCS